MKSLSKCFLLLLLSALAACSPQQEAASSGYASLPDWSGIWQIDSPIGEIDVDGYTRLESFADWNLMGLRAPFKPEVMQKARDFMASGVPAGKSFAWGYPLMMESPTPFQFLITPKETGIINFYREVRHVYTDGREQPPAEDLWPTPWGVSIGHWEGDTLVIETEAVQQPNLFIIPLPMLSEAAHFTERLRMTGPDRIESEFTIVDPATLSEPWVVKLAYKRAIYLDRMFHNEFDNDRTRVTDDDYTIVPSTL